MPRAPQKINPLIFIDFETSGLKCDENAVTEFAGLALDPITFDKILSYENLVKPYDSNLIYTSEAAKHSGITKEMCEANGIYLNDLVKDIIELCQEANIHKSKTAKPIFVAHNWPFDRKWLQEIFRRTGHDLSKYVSGEVDCFGNFVPDGLDSIYFAKYLWGDITDTTTKFKLIDCCQRAGIDCVDSHNAMNDVIPLVDLMIYVISRMRSGNSDVVVQQGQVSIHRQTFEW